MSKVRVLVADDEPIARRGLLKLLASESDVEVVGESRNGVEAVAAIRALKPDLALLDVQMPELDGIGVVRELDRAELPGIIFVTAYDRYAVAAFDLHAVDYVLKPIDPKRFRTALDRARQRLTAERHDQLAERVELLLRDYDATPGTDRLVVRSGNRTYFVPIAGIEWIEAADNYVRLHTADGRHVMRETLRRLEDTLPRSFVRVHRGAIVNLDCIKELRPLASGDCTILLNSGATVSLSRTHREAFDKKVGRPR